jgi:hypothetical protein
MSRAGDLQKAIDFDIQAMGMQLLGIIIKSALNDVKMVCRDFFCASLR